MATFTFSSETLAFHTEFHLVGAHCFLATNYRPLLRAAERWRATTHDASAQSFEMEIIVDSTPRFDRQQRSAHFRGLRHLVFALLSPFGFISYDLLRKRVQGLLTPSAAEDDEFWNSLLLPITIGVLGTTMGIAPLHCACLDRDGSALLLAGHSGAGKSTLAAALAQKGFALISDDWTYVTNHHSSLTAHGLLAPIKLLPDTARFFPRLRHFAPRKTLNGELAYELDPQHLGGVTVRNASRPDQLFFLQRASTPGCHFIPCESEYVRDFFEQSAERLPHELREAGMARSAVIRELSTLPSWIIRSGETPQDTAAALSEFVSEVTHARH